MDSRNVYDVLRNKYKEIIDKNVVTSVNSGLPSIFSYKSDLSVLFRSIAYISENEANELEKIEVDISIQHQNIPKLISISVFKRYIYEFREFIGFARPLSKEYILNANLNYKNRWIMQIIEFSRFFESRNLSFRLFLLDDLVRSCFLDSNNEIHLFDTSFIDLGGDFSANNVSACFLIYQILGGKILLSIDEIVTISTFPDDFPDNWRGYIMDNIVYEFYYVKNFRIQFELKNYEQKTSESTIYTLRSIIVDRKVEKDGKIKIIRSLLKIIPTIFENKMERYSLSPESLTLDTVGINSSLDVFVLNYSIFFIKNEHYIISNQTLNRLGYIIYQLFTNEVIEQIPEYDEEISFHFYERLPTFVKENLLYFWNYSNDSDRIEKILVKIANLVDKRPNSIVFPYIINYNPFFKLTIEQKQRIIEQILEEVKLKLDHSFQITKISIDNIVIDCEFNLLEIDSCCFEKSREVNYFINEKLIAELIDKLLTFDGIDRENLPKYMKKVISLCNTENKQLYVPFNKILSSWKKKRLSKRLKAVLFAIENQIIVKPDNFIEPIGGSSKSRVYLLDDGKVVKVNRTSRKSSFSFMDDKIPKTEINLYKSRNFEEIKNLIFLRSDHVVKIHGVYIDFGKIGIVMDYLPTVLSDIIMKAESLSLKQIIDYSLQIAEAMNFIHLKGIVHRDLKPSNIGVNKKGRVIILDLGSATSFKSKTLMDKVGTPAYMAPEILEGDEYNEKVDVFSFSYIMIELFDGAIVDESRSKSFSVESSDRTVGFRPDIPEKVPTFIRNMLIQCWDSFPSNRPSFDQIIEMLNNSLYESEVRFDSIDWSKKSGKIRFNDYKIFKIKSEDRILIKRAIDSVFMNNIPNLKRVVDYCFRDDEILIVYALNMDPYLEYYLLSVSEDERIDLVTENIEYMITTLDMIRSKNLIHLKMDPKTIYISDRGLIRFGDIYVPGVAENKCDFFDKFDAPELKIERKYTKESNIYSFGVLIAYILHGKTIFNDDGSINVNKINRSYRVAIKKCINKEPNKRVDFQTLYKILFPTKFQCYSQCIDLAETRYSIFQTIKFQANDLEVVKEISNGINSRVYLALNRKNNNEIAVKECYVSGKNKFAISPVYQELAALNVLKHPNLIRILGTVTTRNKGVKILMQYANNGDLASRISTNSLKFDDFVEYLVNIGLGMCFMHGRDVIHRDLKPENILICDKRALVSDFNSAAFVSDRGIPLVFGKYGTVKFMAPEVISDYPYSYSCDVFSFGMIICSFYGADLDYLFNQIQTNEANLDFIDNIDLRYLTKRCIEFDSFKRPTFDFICRYLIKKFQMQNYYKRNIFPSRRDPSLISQMKNEYMAGNNQHASDYGRHLMYENKYEEAKIVFYKGSDGDCLNNYAMFLYLEGNKSESIKYFEKASELDNVYALMVIGISNENPELFDLESDRNIEKALFYYQKAAKEDHNYRCMHLENPKAKYLEGLVHLSNNDIEKANSCFYVATLEFDSDGLNMMGLSIENGTIEEETYDIEDYFRMSASQLNPSGLFNLSRILKNRNPKDSKYYAGLAKLFGGPDVTSYRKPKDVLHESWDMHGQLAEMIRGYEVGAEMGDRKSMKKLREMIVHGYGIYKNESCSKNLSDELSFGIEDSLYE